MNAKSREDQLFLNRLIQITEANLGDENFGVRELAKKLKMNRSHIHRKLKSINKKSASEFIREIRLNKAKEMLMQDIDTVSEIAYKVGFGSPAYFIKCFHDFFGFPPGEYKKYAHENNNYVVDKLNPEYNRSKEIKIVDKINSDGKGLQRNSLLGLFGVLMIVAISLFIYKYFIIERETNPIIKDKSIAVLPTRNLGKDIENQWLADGLVEDILTRLTYIREFDIKSRISSDKYRDPKMSVPEIAEELGVSYILESSIMKDKGKVRINFQLIEAKGDKHVWAKNYDKDLTDIFTFRSVVSKQIAEELEVVLSSHEIEKIEKKYTEDKEAYNFYLLGRFFWHRRTEEDLKSSVKYFNLALARDSNYSLAYAGLSDAFNSMSHFGWYPKEEGVQKSREYALKAISIDYNLSEAHASLGDVAADFDQDWELAEKELKLAIKLDPNFALAYKYYAGYLRRIGKHTEARININKAIELNPESLLIWQGSYYCYYDEGKFEEALKDFERLLEFRNISLGDQWVKFKIYIHQGKDSKAFYELQKYLLIHSPEENYSNQLDLIYAESGIDGIMPWLVEDYFIKQLKGKNRFIIISIYALMKDKDSAIEFLEKCSDVQIVNLLSGFKNNIDVKILQDDPRYKALLEKMKLSDK